MKRSLVALLVGGALVGGCKGEKPAQKAPEKTAERGSTGEPGHAAPGTSPADVGTYVLTQEKLDAYVRYQKALITVYDGLLKGLDRLPAAKPDAGRASGILGSNEALRLLESKAKAEEKARAEAGLSERDAREIERMVMAIINKRNMGRSFDPTGAIKQWEAMRDKLSPEQRAELDKSINDLKAQQEEIVRLTEERKQFGDTNVDLILTREDELTQNYNAYMTRLSGGASPSGRGAH